MPRLWFVGLLTTLLLLGGGLALRADAALPAPPAAAPPAGGPSGCWTLVPGAFPIDNTTELHSVAAFAANDMWTVGFKRNIVGTFPLFEHWDGQTWTQGGPPPGNHGRLYAVAGTAGNDVWVAGSAFYHWNGTQWSGVAYPGSGWMYGLVALAPNDVWAAGDEIAHWDGSAWTVVAHPGGGKTAIAATGPSDIWAVGGDIEHWNGSAWTVVPAPLAGATLYGVAARAPNDAWAVGAITGATDQTYILHWDGVSWAVVPSPSPGPSSSLSGVVALAANDVWAVGEYYGYSNQQTLTEHWDGSAWTVVPSLNNSYRDNRFYAVTAVAAGDLWAVGTYIDGNEHGYTTHLIEHYSAPCPPPPPPVCDTGWDIVRSPSTQGEANYLRAVGIVSHTDAWAVGEHGAGNIVSLIEHWDGQAWTYQASPNVSSLNAIAVRAANDIWAAGDGILYWDGSQWRIVPSASGTVYGLAALAANDAWAVGQGPSGPLTEHWNGSVWTAVPNPATQPLRGVSGVAANDVWAVGGQDRGHGTAVLLHWDGAAWSQIALPAPAPDELRGVTALAAGDVWAVGHRYGEGLYSMHWDGATWSRVPFAIQSSGYYLNSVSGSGANDVWAVGTSIYEPLALAAHWDGAAWSQIWLPWPAYDEAFGVAVRAPDDAWAVGHFDARTMTLHYSGPCPPATATPTASPTATPRTPVPTATASPTPTPAPVCPLRWQVLNYNDTTHSLAAVGVVAPDDVWAVGSVIAHWNGVQWNTLARPITWLNGLAVINAHDIWAVGDAPNAAEHWNGSDWQVIPNFNVNLAAAAALATDDVWAVGGVTIAHWNGANWSIVTNLAQGSLNGLAAVAPNDIWAVGNDGSGGTRAEHWNGTTWSRVPTPNVLGSGNLEDVAFVAPNDGWAVGEYHDAVLNNYQTLIEHWDGTAWTIVPSPNPSAYSILDGLTIVAANDIWAVGADDPIVIEHWDGTSWSLVSSPAVPNNNGRLEAVAAVGAGDLWAVGWTWDGHYRNILVEHYFGDCTLGTATPTPTTTPTRTASPPPSATSTQPQGSPSATPQPTDTPALPSVTATSIATACAIQFSDVDATNPFYPFVRCLACRGVVSGYSDGTYRPGADVTRGQLAKILANAAGLADPIPPTQQTFADVPASQPFWLWIERLVAHQAISGYACGGAGEPCLPPGNRPYFRPAASATRGQIAKIAALAAGIADPVPTTRQTFEDVPPTNAFWLWIEQLAGRGVISGYTCGGPGEPCLPPANRPYFRWGAPTTRGQMAKIAANTFYPGCQTP